MKKVLILLLWLLPSCSVVILAQTQRIAGTVVVGDGQPAVGAAIVVKGTNIGAVTNVDGKFVITEAPASAQQLVVYHVGMEQHSVQRGSRSSQRLYSASARRERFFMECESRSQPVQFPPPGRLGRTHRIQCRCRCGI